MALQKIDQIVQRAITPARPWEARLTPRYVELRRRPNGAKIRRGAIVRFGTYAGSSEADQLVRVSQVPTVEVAWR